jgi:hypothetical protein
MDMNERQIILSVLENLREDLVYARLQNGSFVFDVADLRQYIFELIGRIRRSAVVINYLYGKDDGHGQDMRKSSGPNYAKHLLTYYRWKAKYGGMESGDAKKMKQLEDENRKLKHVVAKLTLDNRALKDVLKELAAQRMRFGYRRLTAMVLQEGSPANHQ